VLTRLNTVILKVEMFVSLCVAALAAIIIILQIVARYLFRSPFGWPEELAVFLLVWLTFLGASILLKRNEHIRVTLLLDKLPERAKICLVILSNISIIVALCIVAYQTCMLIRIQNITRSVSLHIPRGYLFVPLVVASFSMALFVLQSLLDCLRKVRTGMHK
jgi:TRAP-type transport system small permease protein